MTTTLGFTIAVTATDRASLDDQLEEAISAAMAMATKERVQGILVTRHSCDSFTVALSDAVPFGLTREQQEW